MWKARRIRKTWEEHGRKGWNPAINGSGKPLRIGECEFTLERRDVGGRERPCVVCEGVVVEVSP
jgi:hypothetical protein